MRTFLRSTMALILLSTTVLAQDKEVGGACQDCEALFDYRLFSNKMDEFDTLPGFEYYEPKIKITGTVFKNDGKTPATDVILYVYHVNRRGLYQSGPHPKGWEKVHGQHRGWLKTNKKGEYTFYTFRPAAYPNEEEPEHIHIYVKEPNTIPYYVDSILFKNDPKMTKEVSSSQKYRGGSGIVDLEMNNGIWTARRNIILGYHIPDYK